MTNQELIEQNTAIRASIADASKLLDRAYGPSSERLERRIARLIKAEQEARAECERLSAMRADWAQTWTDQEQARAAAQTAADRALPLIVACQEWRLKLPAPVVEALRGWEEGK